MPIKRSRPKKTRVPGIWSDGPSRYLVRVWWKDEKTGRERKRERVASTMAKALELKETLRGTAPTKRPSRPKLESYAESWLETHGRLLADSTYERYIVAVAHLNVGLGDYWVDAITASDVRKWRASVMDLAANPTINGWHRVLRQILDAAVQDGLLQGNPARAVATLPPGRTKGARGTVFSVDKFKAFLAITNELKANKKISPDVARLILTIALSGTRRGEALALKWDDYVDGELFVQRSVWGRKKKVTKTDDPRYISAVPMLVEVLAEQRQWLLEQQHPGLSSGLIFPARPRNARARSTICEEDELVWYRSGSVMDKPLREICKAAGLPQISPHGLRRTWENILRRAGVDQLVRRAVSGWRSEKAQAIYTTVDREDRDEAARAVVRLLGGEG